MLQLCPGLISVESDQEDQLLFILSLCLPGQVLFAVHPPPQRIYRTPGQTQATMDWTFLYNEPFGLSGSPERKYEIPRWNRPLHHNNPPSKPDIGQEEILNFRLNHFRLSIPSNSTRDCMFSAKMAASSENSRSVNPFSPDDGSRSPKLTVKSINPSMKMLNRNGAKTQPSLTPVTIGKNLVGSPPHLTALSVLV